MSTPVLEKASPRVPAPMPDNPASPHMCLGPSKLPSAERLRKFVRQPFKRNSWVSSSLRVPQPKSLLVFTARSFGDFSFQLWNPGLGAWFGVGTPCSSRAASTETMFLLIKRAAHVGAGPAPPVPPPLLPVSVCFLLL